MTSTIIYHYVYRITNFIENKHYYGKRSSKIEPILDLGHKYFSSSHDKHFIQDQKENPTNYKYKIVAQFKTAKEAMSFEIKLHNKFNVGINPAFYNRAKQISTGFNTSSKITVKDSEGKTFQVFISDPRITSGELVGVTKGMTPMYDSNKNMHYVSVSDPRIATGELQYHLKGMATMRDANGIIIKVSVSDPRITSGELVGSTKGMTPMYDSNKNMHYVSVSDPRISSGELVSLIKGTRPMYDSNGNYIRVSTSDPRIATGEIVSVCKDMIQAKDSMGNIKMVSKDSLEWKSGKLVGITKGEFPAIDRAGNKRQISKDSYEWKNDTMVAIQRINIFVTPHGLIINDYTKIPRIKLYNMCIKYNNYSITKLIFEKYKPYLESIFNFDEIEGKTFRELGFGIEKWLNDQ